MIGGPKAGLVHSAKAKLGVHPAQVLAKQGKLNFQCPKFIAQNTAKHKARIAKLKQEGAYICALAMLSFEQRQAINASAIASGKHAWVRRDIIEKTAKHNAQQARIRYDEADYNRLKLIYACKATKNLPKHLWQTFAWKLNHISSARLMLRAIAKGLTYQAFIQGAKLD